MDFEIYARESTAPLLRFALVLTNDAGLAQDVVQDVLLRALSHWDRIGTLPHPHAYVRRMVVNEFVSWRRKWARVVPTSDAELDRPVPDASEMVDLRSDLIGQLATLPRSQRAAVVMRYFEDMSDAEIAAALGCRPTTARGYLHRGLKNLRIGMNASDPSTQTLPLEQAEPC